MNLEGQIRREHEELLSPALACDECTGGLLMRTEQLDTVECDRCGMRESTVAADQLYWTG